MTENNVPAAEAPAPAATEAPAQAVATTAQAGVPVSADFFAKMQKDQGLGFENVEAAHLNIPVISLLQDMSHQVKEQHEAHVEGAKPGMVYLSSDKSLIPQEQGVDFVPVFWEETFTEWKPNRGGFVQAHDSSIRAQAEFTEGSGLMLPNRNELLVSSVFYVYLKQGNFYTPAVLRLAKSMHKIGKSILTDMKSKRFIQGKESIDNMPMSSMLIHLDVTTKQDGDDIWYVWREGGIKFLWETMSEAEAAELYNKACALGKQFKSGALKDKIDNPAEEVPQRSSSTAATQQAPPAQQATPQAEDDSDDIPY